jgi:CDGSH iron-sulfur domain-containing protein 3
MSVPHSCCTDDGFKDCPCWTKEGQSLPQQVIIKSTKVYLMPGESRWCCMCGQSATFPWCDGAHERYNATNGTNIVPFEIKNETDAVKKFSICTCAHSKKRPFCDGTHKKVKHANEM